MADGDVKREELVIWTNQLPSGEAEKVSKAEILRLLHTSDKTSVTGAGTAYLNSATAVTNAIQGLEENAGKILTIWQGPDADKARVALELLYASGAELSKKLTVMGNALHTYADYVPPVISEVQGIAVTKDDQAVKDIVAQNKSGYGEVGGNTGIPRSEMEANAQTNAIASVENSRAQEALGRLNQKIQTLHIVELPYSIVYELPAVTIPPVPGDDTTPVDYGGSTGSTGPTFRNDASNYRTGGSTTGGSRSGNTSGGDSSSPGGKQDGGDHPGGKDGDTPGDSRPDQQSPDGSGTPGGQDQQQQDPTGQNNNQQDPKDGTAPPVIGANDKTSVSDASPQFDPSQTETSSYQPPVITPTTIGNTPVTTTVSPIQVPTASTPGVPSVIGSPGANYSPSGGLLPVRGGAGAGMSGMPMMPMMGGGGPMGEDGDSERTTYLAEDKSAWTSGRDVTDPVIK